MAVLPKRIIKETERLMAEPYVLQGVLLIKNHNANGFYNRVPGISAIPHEDNLRYFDVLIHGPSQSPYEGKTILPELKFRG